MSTRLPRVGLSLVPEEGFRAAAAPLFEAGVVEVLEWCLDIPWGFKPYQVPAWADAVIDLYSNAGCLYGHGMTFSALSARWEPRQEEWLEKVRAELGKRNYVTVSEHFGFISATGFLPSAPIPVPMTAGSIRTGTAALGRLADVVGAPVGLENLAPILGRHDAEVQGEFLGALLEPGDGFLLLDLHNLYCQAQWTGIPLRTLLDQLPLHRVREMHVAGGRGWTPPLDPDVVLQVDTHDGPVPDPVFAELPYAIDACPNLEAIFLERFPYTTNTEPAQAELRADYERLLRTVESCRHD